MGDGRTVTSEKGERLLDMVRRVYQIRDHDRVLQVALIVSGYSPANRLALMNRFGVPLAGGIAIEFPSWAEIEKRFKSFDARRQNATSQITTAALKKTPDRALAPREHTRQVAISRGMGAPISERDSIKEMIKAVGMNATEAMNGLKPLGIDDLDPAATQSAFSLKISGVGKKIAEGCTAGTLNALLSQSDKGFGQAFELVLKTLSPRAFAPGIDLGPTLHAIYASFFSALTARLVREAQAEYARRVRLMQRALARGDVCNRLRQLNSPQLSFAYARVQGGAALLEQLAADLSQLPPTPPVLPKILAQLREQYGVTTSAFSERMFFAPASARSPFEAFVDEFAPGGVDGVFAAELVALASRVTDVHRQTVQASAQLLADFMLDGRLSPNEALAKVLSPLLKRMRAERLEMDNEGANRRLADERHLLSGRNFLTFRKDVTVAIDKRLTLAVQLVPEQRVAVLLALLIQDGHRLPVMRLEEIENTCDRFIQAMP